MTPPTKSFPTKKKKIIQHLDSIHHQPIIIMAESSEEDSRPRTTTLTLSKAIDMDPVIPRSQSLSSRIVEKTSKKLLKTFSSRTKTDSESSDQSHCQFAIGDSSFASLNTGLSSDSSSLDLESTICALVERLPYLFSFEEQLSKSERNMLIQEAQQLLTTTDKFLELVCDNKSPDSDLDQVDHQISCSAPETSEFRTPEAQRRLASHNFNLYKDRSVDLDQKDSTLKRTTTVRRSFRSIKAFFRRNSSKSIENSLGPISIEGPFSPKQGIPVGLYMEQYFGRIEAARKVEDEQRGPLEMLMRKSRPPFFAELKTNKQFISINDDRDDEELIERNNETRNRSSDTSSSETLSLTKEMSDKKARNAYRGALEIMTSEQNYVFILKLVFYDYRDFILEEIRKNPQLVPVQDFDQIFVNMREILAFNSVLLSDFKSRIENWNQKPKIADVLTEKGQFLRIYSTFIKEFSTSNEKFKTLKNKYPGFKDFTESFEARDVCAHLKIEHFLLKPVQRLPQYQLLLKKYIENLTEDSLDFQDAKTAFSIVGQATNHADDMKGHVDNFQAMLDLQHRLGMDDLIQPNRAHIRNGTLRKRNRTGIFDDIFLVLATDILIYARPNSTMVTDMEQAPLKVIHEIPLTDMRVSEEANSDEFPCDFHIESRVRSFGLRAKTRVEKDEWVADLDKAIRSNLERMKSFHKKCFETSDRDLGDLQPLWIPDDRVTMCQKCFVDFNFFVQRRHHCRSCGSVVCASCSDYRAPLKYANYQAERVCSFCHEYLMRKMKEDKDLKKYESKFSGSRKSFSSSKDPPMRLLMKGSDKRLNTTGFLHKKASKTGKWNKLWFGLQGNTLYTFKAQDDPKAAQSTPILGYDLILNSEVGNEKKATFPQGQCLTLSHVSGDSIFLFAENEDTSEKWIKAFTDSIRLHTENDQPS
ncbi:hypothetical protein TCAL_02326 [Tigriopus californicus]|uniref:FYVE, RhoGEF and PH domain-containing protein 4 n=2 Tax=Tigriopus californicus TaxID=6832 RepID=A0A553NYV3_TIGCA|nr:FYVE, RhoGEF and PH domain-containing protein 4-like isoform X1 [Tigriopus californicus]TRY70611.1 hypothetical protein TCAL_02326 [Tigriopus californicus]